MARHREAAGVTYLDPAPAVFEAMLAGWERQQRALETPGLRPA
jgi:hypothetical protein